MLRKNSGYPNLTLLLSALAAIVLLIISFLTLNTQNYFKQQQKQQLQVVEEAPQPDERYEVVSIYLSVCTSPCQIFRWKAAHRRMSILYPDGLSVEMKPWDEVEHALEFYRPGADLIVEYGGNAQYVVMASLLGLKTAFVSSVTPPSLWIQMVMALNNIEVVVMEETQVDVEQFHRLNGNVSLLVTHGKKVVAAPLLVSNGVLIEP